jgi:hypothetical protein
VVTRLMCDPVIVTVSLRPAGSVTADSTPLVYDSVVVSPLRSAIATSLPVASNRSVSAALRLSRKLPSELRVRVAWYRAAEA